MTPPQHQPRGHFLLMANLVAQLAFGLLAMTVCLPSMQDWPAVFGSTQAAVQLTFSGFIAAYGGMQLVYGPLSDRFGRKPVLMSGLVIAGTGSLVAALASDLTVLTLGRVLQGAGSAAGMVTARAMVQDLFQGPDRTRVMAFIGMSMGVVPPVSTLLGGQLHVRVGWQAGFVVMTGLAVLLMIAAWKGLPDPKPQRTGGNGGLRSLASSYARLAREPAFLLYVLLLSACTATFYSFLGGTPLVLGAYGVGPEALGWYIGAIPIAYIFGNLITTRLAHRRSDHFIMGWGQALTLGGLVLVLVLGWAGWRSPLALALPMLLLGVGHGLLVPPALTGTVGLIPALAGSAAAVAGLSQQLLGALGGFVVGTVSHQGQVNLGALMLLWTSLGLAAQLMLLRRGRRMRAAA
jgi:DHA1 family bicyclomycin/chloramphenicol resistance-like MFS transporter